MDSKKRRYQEELKRIRQLSAINKVLKKGDVENAFLNNTDKDSEITKDTAVEKMLEDLQADKNESKDLAMLDSVVGANRKMHHKIPLKKVLHVKKVIKGKKSQKKKR